MSDISQSTRSESAEHSQPSQQQFNNQHEPMVPPEPSKFNLPIPSKQILPVDEKFKKKQFQYSESGSLILNSHNLKLLCIKEGLYEYPDLNSKLYLHFKCIERIQSLNEYINLKTLYLQNNVIKKIQNLECLPHLQNLFLQHNMIQKIQNLDHNNKLIVLNLSYNNIFKIQGLSELQQLQNLTITNNYLQKFDSLVHLGECSAQLTSIDLSNNKITADHRLFDIVTQVKCLYLSGNPVVREVEHYRRTVVGKLKNLLYLDQRAVNEDERLLAQTWVKEGDEGLKKVRQMIEMRKSQRKLAQKEQLMKDINSHRNRKLNLFRKSIQEAQQQIEQLKRDKHDANNVNMQYYYDSRIQEKQMKIKELQNFIEDITCRIEGREVPKRTSINEEKDNQVLEQDTENEDKVTQNIEEVQKQKQKQEGENPQSSGKNNKAEAIPKQIVQGYSLDELD